MLKMIISAKDLRNMGYRKYQSKNIIREAKQIMVNRGYGFYNNKRLGLVPSRVVSHIIGIPLNRGSLNHEK